MSSRYLSTVTLGILGNWEAALGALSSDEESEHIEAGGYSADVMKRILFSKTRETLRLAEVTVGGLGFTQNQTEYDAICGAIKGRGLRLCPAEAGVAYILTRPKSLREVSSRVIAMSPIEIVHGPMIFFVFGDRTEERRGFGISTNSGVPRRLYYPDARFVVAIPPEMRA